LHEKKKRIFDFRSRRIEIFTKTNLLTIYLFLERDANFIFEGQLRMEDGVKKAKHRDYKTKQNIFEDNKKHDDFLKI